MRKFACSQSGTATHKSATVSHMDANDVQRPQQYAGAVRFGPGRLEVVNTKHGRGRTTAGCDKGVSVLMASDAGGLQISGGVAPSTKTLSNRILWSDTGVESLSPGSEPGPPPFQKVTLWSRAQVCPSQIRILRPRSFFKKKTSESKGRRR